MGSQSEIPTSVDQIDWDNWEFREHAVLCFIRETDRILLIHKKTGLGAGKINGPGGRIDPGESALQAAIRETTEETGLTPISLEQTAELSFVFLDGYSLFVTVFTADGFRGQLTQTTEADPFWCQECEIPYTRMWEDDAIWLPRVLSGEYIKGCFIYSGDRSISHRID